MFQCLGLVSVSGIWEERLVSVSSRTKSQTSRSREIGRNVSSRSRLGLEPLGLVRIPGRGCRLMCKAATNLNRSTDGVLAIQYELTTALEITLNRILR
jgi:hypothetical protein